MNCLNSARLAIGSRVNGRHAQSPTSQSASGKTALADLIAAGCDSDNRWAAFMLDYTGSVDGDLGGYVEWVNGKIAGLQGTPPPDGDPHTPLIDAETNLSELPQAVLQAEMARIEQLVSADKETQRKYSAVSKTIARETAELTTLTARLEDYEGAMDRAHELNRDREDAYGRAFDALEAEEAVLEHL